MAEKYDGKYPADYWLTKLEYDFEQNNLVPPPPALYLKAIKVLFTGDATTWLFSTPRMRQIIDAGDSATVDEVREFEEALKEQFSADAEIGGKSKCCRSTL